MYVICMFKFPLPNLNIAFGLACFRRDIAEDAEGDDKCSFPEYQSLRFVDARMMSKSLVRVRNFAAIARHAFTGLKAFPSVLYPYSTPSTGEKFSARQLAQFWYVTYNSSVISSNGPTKKLKSPAISLQTHSFAKSKSSTVEQ